MGVTNFVGEAWRAGKSFVTGLNITFREMMFRPAITVFYPDVKDDVPPWFRGIPVQKTDLLTGEYKCTSCMQCAEACPVGVINIEWHQDPETKKKVSDRFAIDMSRCMLCNLCVEACPFDSLVMGMDYELCKVEPENLVFEFEDLLRLGLKYSKAEDPNAKKKAGTPPWVFAGLTNATEEDIQDAQGYLGRPPLPKGYVPELKPQFRKQEEEPAEAPAEAPKPVAAARPAAEPKPAAEAKPAAEVKPAAEAKPAEETKPAAEAKPSAEAIKDGEGAGQP